MSVGCDNRQRRVNRDTQFRVALMRSNIPAADRQAGSLEKTQGRMFK
jgi:hypothetical protein